MVGVRLDQISPVIGDGFIGQTRHHAIVKLLGGNHLSQPLQFGGGESPINTRVPAIRIVTAQGSIARYDDDAGLIRRNRDGIDRFLIGVAQTG